MADATPSGFVYGICLEGGPVRYVGITTKPLEVRLKQHLYAASKGHRSALMCWLRKHPDAQIRPLETHDDLASLKAAETRLILELRTHVDHGLGGLNGTLGGDGAVGISEEARLKISRTVAARWAKDADYRDRLVAAHVGLPVWNKGLKGTHVTSPETRVRMSAAHKANRPKERMAHARAAFTADVIARRNQAIRHAWHVKKNVTDASCGLCEKGVV